MSNNYITEAFKQFYLTEDAEEFQLSSSGPAESKSLIDLITGDDEDILSDVYDLEAEAKEDLKNSYMGKVILDCNVCHSNVFFDKDQVSENEDGLCCVEIECPYCMSNEGYTIIGEVAPYGEVPDEPYEEQEEPEIDIEAEEVEIEEPDSEETANEADIEEKEDEEDMDEEYLKSSEKLAPSKELSEACCKEECEDELEEGLKADKVKELDGANEISGEETGIDGIDTKGLEANNDIRGPKYQEFNESCNKKRKLKEDWDEDSEYSLDDGEIEAIRNIIESSGCIDSSNEFYDIYDFGLIECEKDDSAYAIRDVLRDKGIECSLYDPGDRPLEVKIDWVPSLDESCLKEETDLTKTKGQSIAKLIQDNHKILDNAGTKERLAAEVKRLFDEAGYETPATKKVLYNLSKARDFVSALTYIYNVFLKGSGNGVVESCDMEEACSVEEGCKCDEGCKDTIEESQEINEVAPIVAAGARMVAGAAAKSLADKAVDKVLGEECEDKECSSVNEAIEDISINTEDETMTMSSKPDGGVTIETTPKIGDLGIEDEGEMIAPLSPETEADINTAIENNTEDEENILGDLGIEDEVPVEDDFEDFDEESFNDLGESYLKRCYENVNSFKTTGISNQANGSFLIEGVIKFDSGNIKETQFEFTPSESNKLKLEGYNRQISNGKKTFKLSCSVDNKKLVCESLNFNYKSKNELNESVRVYGTVKRKASK